MATVNREAIDTFISITGVPEPIAVRRLEAYGGNLNEAINAHFSEGDRNPLQEAVATVTAQPSDFMDIDNPLEMQHRGPGIDDVANTLHEERPQTRGTTIADDDDDRIREGLLGNRISGSNTNNQPSAPPIDDSAVHENDIEEQMIRAAIEASKRDAELLNKQPVQVASHHDDADLEHVVSLSLEKAEQERLRREHGLESVASGSGANKPVETVRMQGFGTSGDLSLNQQKKGAGSSSVENIEDSHDHHLVRNTLRHRSSGSEETEREVGEAEVSPLLSPSGPTVASQIQPDGNGFHAHEWGGISSEEHDEAVMLEAAMFGGIPESRYRLPNVPHQPMSSTIGSWRSPRPPSPSLIAQRTIREQQDDEYLAALQADREKELLAMEEEKAAKETERRKAEEVQRKSEEEQELERQLAAKQASLPEEPPLDNENAVTLLVRMPNGSRRGRRFLKTDKLESLFSFIDVGRGVKPGTYRLVRPYPRRAFSAEESNLTLDELGLTSKQEALFLESI